MEGYGLLTMLPPMKPSWKTILFTTAKFAVPAALIGYLLWRVEPADWQQLSDRPRNDALLIAALAVATVAVSLSFVRWCVLVRCQGIELSMVEAFRLGAIGFLLSFVSAGSVGGDLFKAIFLAQRRPGKRVEAVASVLVDRGSGFYALLLLVSVALLTTHPAAGSSLAREAFEQIRLATLVLMALGTVVLAALVFGGRRVDRLVRRAATWRYVGGVIEHVGKPLRMFHSHPVAFTVSILMSLGVQSLLVFSMYLIARSLYSAPPTLGEHFVIVPIGMLTSALPITPAGLGVLEATMEWLYTVIPAEPTAAKGTIVALVFELVRVIMAVLGTIFYWTAGEEVRHSLEAADQQWEEGTVGRG